MVADQLWVVAGGKVTPFDGDIDDYRTGCCASATAARATDATRA